MFQEEESSAAAARTSLKTILVVEDDQDIGELFMQAISSELQYFTYLSRNGAEALRFASQIKPNLLLLDYHLPDMSGIDLYDQLRAMPALETVPVIFLTADEGKDIMREIERRRLPAIMKPFDLDEFLRAVNQALT